jgi:hypothetical protein
VKSISRHGRGRTSVPVVYGIWGLSMRLYAIRQSISLIGIALAGLVTGDVLYGQSFLRSLETAQDAPRGFRIDGITSSTGYYSSFSPFTSVSQLVPGTLQFGAEISNTVSASLGYHWRSPTSNFAIVYTPSYVANVRNSQFNAVGHDISITGSHPLQIGPRLTMDFNASANVSNARQYLFNMGVLDQVVGTPATFEQLSAAALGTPLTNNGIASLLTGSSVVGDSAARQLFYGDRVLVGGLQTNLTYSWSPRLRLTFGLGGTRYQHLSRPSAENTDASAGSNFLLAQNTAVNAAVSVSYSLSPRTQIAWDLDTSRSFSRLQQGFVNTSMLAIGRNMGSRWFARINGGVGLVNINGNTSGRSKQPQYIAGGSLGAKTRAHTFMMTAQRTITNTFGVAYNTDDAQASWSWRSQNRAWLLSGGSGYQRLNDTERSKLSGWRGMVSAGRKLGPQVLAQLQFAYSSYSGRFNSLPSNFTQRGVLLSLSWMPSAPASKSSGVR